MSEVVLREGVAVSGSLVFGGHSSLLFDSQDHLSSLLWCTKHANTYI